MRKIIFDTDPGIDDAMALLLIGATPTLELAGICSVFGNADIAVTTRNAHYLVDRFGLAAPVRRGAAGPIAGLRRVPPVHVHGEGGLGPTNFAGYRAPAADPEPAHAFINRLTAEQPGEITLVAVGPLTNLALALRADPGVAERVAEVIVMGGSFGRGPRPGNVSPIAEANVANDPEAADEVFAAAWPVTVVGLDVTMACVLAGADEARLAADGGEAGRFLHAISRDYAAMYAAIDGLAGCALHDVAAVVHASDPQLFAHATGAIRVVADGIAAGQTILKPDGMAFPPGAWDGRPSHRICTAVEPGTVARLFVDRIVAWAR